MLKIDVIAYNSPLKKINPSLKLITGFMPLILCLCLNSFGVCIFTLCVMAYLSVEKGRVNIKQYLRLLCVPLSFVILGTVTVIFGQHSLSEPLLLGFTTLTNGYGITRASLGFGMLLIIKALACVSCMYFISLNTPMNQLQSYFRKLKFPKIFITLTELIYRFIFVILEQSRKIKTAQQSRLGYTGFKNSIKSSGILIGSVFIKTQSRCDNIYNALQSRGYDGEIKTLTKKYENSPQLIIITVIVSCLLLLIRYWETKI